MCVKSFSQIVRQFASANKHHCSRAISYALVYAFAIVVIHSIFGGLHQSGGIRGMVAPMDFIPFAEQTGLIRGLTNWILREAMHDTVLWRERGEPLQISVNVFAADLADPSFEVAVLALAQQTNVLRVISGLR
jgi:predicted signal transduction protein with EAL and GGDEF domain